VSKCDFSTYIFAVRALESLGADLKGRIELQFTYDEEFGGELGPGWLLKNKLTKPDLAIAAGFSYQIITAHNGCLQFEVTVNGKMGHAAVPTSGVDALQAAVKIMNESCICSIFATGEKICDNFLRISFEQSPIDLNNQFDLNRDDTDTAAGAVMSGYQVKSLPAIEKQRLIQFPLYCYDVEMDKYNNIVGSEDDRAFDRISELEGIEKTGNIVTVQDFRTDETYSALIEEIRFFSATPPSERFNGFGGKLLLTVRKL
jgi:hypothetical protein